MRCLRALPEAEVAKPYPVQLAPYFEQSGMVQLFETTDGRNDFGIYVSVLHCPSDDSIRMDDPNKNSSQEHEYKGNYGFNW